MGLAEAYKGYVDNGGRIAIRGYNFQTYVGVFLMLYLHKNNHSFEISLEKDDDISLNDLTSKETFKIQVKSEPLTPSKIVKATEKEPRSILGKLLFNSDNYDYAILVFGQEKGEKIKEICKEENQNLGTKSYSIDWDRFEDIKKEKAKSSKILNSLATLNKIEETFIELDCIKEKLFFHEAPFTIASDNCLNYLCGYSPNTYKGALKKIEVNENQLLGILGSLYHSIDESSQILKFDNTIFQEIEQENEFEKLVNELLEELRKDTSIFQNRKLKNNRADFIENREIYENYLSKFNLPKYLDNESFSNYLEINAKMIEEKLDATLKKRINIFIIEWYIIYKIIEEIF